VAPLDIPGGRGSDPRSCARIANRASVKIEDIQRLVANHYNVKPGRYPVLAPRRRPLCDHAQIAMYLAKVARPCARSRRSAAALAGAITRPCCMPSARSRAWCAKDQELAGEDRLISSGCCRSERLIETGPCASCSSRYRGCAARAWVKSLRMSTAIAGLALALFRCETPSFLGSGGKARRCGPQCLSASGTEAASMKVTVEQAALLKALGPRPSRRRAAQHHSDSCQCA